VVKAERLKELEKTYEAISLKLGPKGKSGLRKCSVPDKKLTALDEYTKKMAFKQRQEPHNSRVETRNGEICVRAHDADYS
jgi:hypothetical protein